MSADNDKGLAAEEEVGAVVAECSRWWCSPRWHGEGHHGEHDPDEVHFEAILLPSR